MKSVTFKQLETALKQLYGKDACINIVEPIVCIPLLDMVEEVASFEQNIAIILYKHAHRYNPQHDSIDLIRLAKQNGDIVIPIPYKQAPYLHADSTIRGYDRICTKYTDAIFILPEIDISSIYDEEIPCSSLIKSGAKEIVEFIKGYTV